MTAGPAPTRSSSSPPGTPLASRALRLVAGNQEKDLGDASIRANVGLGRDSNGNFGLAVELVGRMPNLSREEAEALMAEAHQVCPYSRATRGNVDVELAVED